MSDTLITVDNVSKKFCRSLKKSLWYGVKDMSSEFFGGSNSHNELREGEFWANKDISFEVKRGETIGLIGHNGAGKTTLLRMLSGLIKPDKGRIEIRGRMQALIALGAGFNPILTGRENVYVNAAVLGIRKKTIDNKIDEIIDFSGLEEFIDSPVQSYSSGMAVRLGFSVAVNMEPEILLVDEVLAVGDSNFIIKSLNKIHKMIKDNGTAILFVSHSNTMIRAVCQNALYLEKGIVKGCGDVMEVTRTYELDCMDKRTSESGQKIYKISSDKERRIKKVELYNFKYELQNVFKINEPLVIRVYVHADRVVENPGMQIAVFNEKKECMLSQVSFTDGIQFHELLGSSSIDFKIKEIPFNTGVYSVSAKFIDGNVLNSLDYHIDACQFTVDCGNRVGNEGKVCLNAEWIMENC